MTKPDRWMEEDAIDVLLQAIDRQVAVENILYRGLHAWPVLRAILFHRLSSPPLDRRLPDHDSRPGWLDAAVRDFARSWNAPAEPAALAANRTMRHNQRMEELVRAVAELPGGATEERRPLLFLSHAPDNFGRLDGLPCNTILDPIIERARGRGPVLRLELGPPEPRRLPTLFSDVTPWMLADLAREREFEDDGAIAGLEPFTDFLRRETGIGIGRHAFIDQLWRIWSLARFCGQVLAVVRPAAVFLINYHQSDGHALAFACRAAGIPLIDVQHGMQGRHHAVYSGFRCLPAEGFNTIPDLFWVWGERFAANIARIPPFGVSVHRPVVVGHPWLIHWAEAGPEKLGDPEVEAFLNDLSSYRRRVLVTLQPGIGGEEISPAIKGCIERSPKDWCWLIRRHPVMERGLDDLTAEVRAAGWRHAEVRFASTLPLPLLLRHVNRHVTAFSSSAHEAAACGIGTVAVDERAALYLHDLVASGICRLAGSAGELLDALDADAEGARAVSLPPALVTDPSRMDAALEELWTAQPSGRTLTAGGEP